MPFNETDIKKTNEILKSILHKIQCLPEHINAFRKLEHIRKLMLDFIIENEIKLDAPQIIDEMRELALVLVTQEIETITYNLNNWIAKKALELADITYALQNDKIYESYPGSIRDYTCALKGYISSPNQIKDDVEILPPLQLRKTHEENFKAQLCNIINIIMQINSQKKGRFLIAIEDSSNYWRLLKITLNKSKMDRVTIWDPIKTEIDLHTLPIYTIIQTVFQQFKWNKINCHVEDIISSYSAINAYEKKKIFTMDYVLQRAYKYIEPDDRFCKLFMPYSIRRDIAALIRRNNLSFRMRKQPMAQPKPVEETKKILPRKVPDQLKEINLDLGFFPPAPQEIKEGSLGKERDNLISVPAIPFI